MPESLGAVSGHPPGPLLQRMRNISVVPISLQMKAQAPDPSVRFSPILFQDKPPGFYTPCSLYPSLNVFCEGLLKPTLNPVSLLHTLT